MKPFVLTLFAALHLFGANAQHPWPPEGEKGVDFYLNDTQKPKPNGLHYRTYDNGNIYYSGIFENGKPAPNSEFFYYFYDAEGRVMTKHTFGDDISQVANESFFKTGKIQAKGDYIHQKKEGTWTFYDPQGIVTSIDEFHLDSLHGTSKTFYPSGRQFQQLEYDNGAPHGEWIEWFEDGKIKVRGGYKDGTYHGSYEQNHASGVKMLTGEYVDGIKDEIWMSFLSDGKIQKTMKYDMGTLKSERIENGEHKEFYQSGLPKSVYQYKDGNKHGPFEEWYDLGGWVRKPTDGPERELGYQFKETLEGTQLSREGEYRNGKLEGEIIYYDEHGRITKTEYYVDGNLESTE